MKFPFEGLFIRQEVNKYLHKLTAARCRGLAAGIWYAVVPVAEGGVLPVGVVGDAAALEVALHGVPGVGDALELVALPVVAQPLVHLVVHDVVHLAAEDVHRDGSADLQGKSEVVMKKTDPECGKQKCFGSIKL